MIKVSKLLTIINYILKKTNFILNKKLKILIRL